MGLLHNGRKRHQACPAVVDLQGQKRKAAAAASDSEGEPEESAGGGSDEESEGAKPKGRGKAAASSRPAASADPKVKKLQSVCRAAGIKITPNIYVKVG